MNNNLVHFCAHFGMSFFLCSLLFSLLSINLSFNKRILLSILISLNIGNIYKYFEALQYGDYSSLNRSMFSNSIGCLQFVSIKFREKLNEIKH